MKLLDGSVTISAPAGNITLDDVGPFRLVAVGAGLPQWRRQVVEGRYQHGRAVVGVVLETQILTVVVRIRDASWVAHQNRLGELTAALSQFSYTVTTTLEGHVRTYVCEPADIELVNGDTWEKFGVANGKQEYLLRIPYNPAGVS